MLVRLLLMAALAWPTVVPGAVPPLGDVYGVETLLDEALNSLAHVYFEAGDHERLIKVETEQFKSLMLGVRHGHFSDAS